MNLSPGTTAVIIREHNAYLYSTRIEQDTKLCHQYNIRQEALCQEQNI